MIVRSLVVTLSLAISASAAVLPTEKSYSLEAIELMLEAAEYEKAIAALDDHLKKQPRDADALLLRSTAHIMKGDVEAGRLDLERLISAEPARREGWINRAALDLAESRFEAALEGFLEAERIDPEASDNSLNIGATLLFSGDREAASARFRRYLESNTRNPDAFFLVAANYAMAGTGDVAVPLLERAIAIDETVRMRIRTDPVFADLAQDDRFQNLLNTDPYRPAEGSLQAVRIFQVPYAGRGSRVLAATLAALQLSEAPVFAGIEVTPSWALVQSKARIKIAAGEQGETVVSLTAKPESFTPREWSSWSEELFRQITIQLHSRRPEQERETNR